jgi:hypothetical protein
VTGELPNANLATITDVAKINNGLLSEAKLDTDVQGKLGALQTDGKVKGQLVKSTDSTTLIDTSTGKVTANLQSTTGVELDSAVNNAADLHARAIAEPHEDANVLKASIVDQGSSVYTYRLAHQAAGACVNIGELGDDINGLIDLLDSAGGDLLDASSDPVTVLGFYYDAAATNQITPGDTQPSSGYGAGWWFNDGSSLPNSTVYIKVSAVPATGVTNFDCLYSKRNVIGNLGRNALVKKAVIQGEADPNITATIKDLKGTADWNTAVSDGRQLIDLTDTNGKIASGKVIEGSILDSAVTTDKIGLNAVTTAKIATGAVDTNELAADAVTTAKIDASAVGTTELATEAVTTDKLDHEAVTSVKIADDAITQLKLGNNAAGSGEIKADILSLAKMTDNKLQTAADGSVKLGSGVPLKHSHDDSTVITSTGLIGTGKVTTGAIQDSAVTGGKVAPLAVDTGHLAEDAVTLAKIADNAVGSGQIATEAVIAGKIGASAVGTTELANSAVTDVKIGSNAVTTAKLDTSAVTAAKIGAGAVETSKINDDAVTNAKIGPGAVDTTELADSAVETSQLALNAVTTDRITNLAVSTGKLANDAVDNSKLADNAVATANLQAGSVTGDELGTGAVTKDKVAADVFSELSTTNLVSGGSFENGAWT